MNLVLYKIKDYGYVFINIREDGRRSLRMVFWFMILKLSSYKALKLQSSQAINLQSSQTLMLQSSQALKFQNSQTLML